MSDAQSIYDQVREYYGQTLQTSDDLHSTCCTSETPPRYVLDVMRDIDDEIIAKFYGCGSPIPPALEGATVLDLGCGSGRDVYVLSKLVGKNGRVIGVDMTEEQLAVARAHQQNQAERFGYERSNVSFKQGYIEDLATLGIEDESVDVVVSNCVINLSPFKDQVFSEIYRVLKPGGELYFSDVFASHRIPEYLQNDPVLRGECLGGAMYTRDFKRMMEAHGWNDFAVVSEEAITVGNFELETKLGFISFVSRTIRAVKAEGMDNLPEDYGQQATYNGGMPETPRYFDFDRDIRFIKGKPHAISGTIAAMLSQSRYGAFFTITPARKHRGPFDAQCAQEALDVRAGKTKVDLSFVQASCDRCGIEPFATRVGERSLLTAHAAPSTMQVNITYACNLACRHCYLECGPNNTQTMSRQTMQNCLEAFAAGDFKVMDITGGSPELHPDFKWFMSESSKLGHVIIRSNLTLLDQPEYAPLMQDMARCGVRIVASLPFYNGDGADAQRGSGVFARALRVILELNKLGYGRNDDLPIDIVYNVAGPFLPPPQELVQEAYEKVLMQGTGIEFNDLLAFNNYPMGRFAFDLQDAGMYDEYMALLSDNFNALALTRIMCADQINVDYDGRLYDCEVNHVLDLPVQLDGRDATIEDITATPLCERIIRTNPVCYSCSAGFGSSCGGSLV